MSVASEPSLRDYCVDVARRARRAAEQLADSSGAARNQWLREAARRLREQAAELVDANRQDVAGASGYGLSDAQIDRLRLTPKTVESMAVALEEIAAQHDPLGEVIESSIRPNGLEIQKIRVPLGVVFFIYESRPNVTADAAGICIKSGNAVILRGGKEAAHSNAAIAAVLGEAAQHSGLPHDAVQLVSTTDREAVGEFLALDQFIDVAIPRGGEGLIRRVVEQARMPVMKHFAGNCHVYVDRLADLDMAERITINAKCQRNGVCNAAESLLVHRDVADDFVPRIALALAAHGVELRGDEPSRALAAAIKPAVEDDYFAEYLGPIISIRVADSLDEAIRHINHYGSRHTESIITQGLAEARQFARQVDSAAVMINASTRFNDGGQFGLGAEIGISTDKFHARGPCGVKELTSYKYVVYGNGHIRE